MKKIELEIKALSSSISQTHSYAVVLGEINGMKRLPIVIGGYEAQAIAVALERIKPSRPLTHDLFANVLYTFDVELQEVIIHKFEDGIFYAKLICHKNGETVEIDSRTSDALALAVRMGCKIYTYQHILDNDGLYLDPPQNQLIDKATEEISDTTIQEPSSTNNLKDMAIDELEQLLNQILEQEDYAQAIAIRDELKKRKKK